MSNQLDILFKVMVALKEEQTVAVDNIQALLNNRDNEVNLISKIIKENKELALIESAMAQNDFFMEQIKKTIKDNLPKKPEE